MSSPKKKLTILFAPLDGWGHINCCHGMAEEFLKRGHRVVFAVNKSFQNKLRPFGFEEELLITGGSDGGAKWYKVVETLAKVMESPNPIDVVLADKQLCGRIMLDDIMELDDQYHNIIQRVDPDLIVVDNYNNIPSITNSGRPWIWLYSAVPLGLYHCDDLPPISSGYPTNELDKSRWIAFKERISVVEQPIHKRLDEYCQSKGAPPLPVHSRHPRSPYLNIYLYIKELDYTSKADPLPQNFIRVESFFRTTNEKFEIPEKLAKRSGALIYLSMGSFGCANLKLMTRLTSILGKSKHRFIVAKGPQHENYKLPENMWGQQFAPQMAVLPLVDAVITHGGNNTVMESFYFGKPMLVMPLFGDQYDNGQRLLETGCGLRLNPFHCTEQELIASVDKLISDQSFTQKCSSIGQRIRNTNDKKKVVDIIENMIN